MWYFFIYAEYLLNQPSFFFIILLGWPFYKQNF